MSLLPDGGGVQSGRHEISSLCGKSQETVRCAFYWSSVARRSVAVMSEERVSGSVKECPEAGEMRSSASGQARVRRPSTSRGTTATPSGLRWAAAP